MTELVVLLRSSRRPPLLKFFLSYLGGFLTDEDITIKLVNHVLGNVHKFLTIRLNDIKQIFELEDKSKLVISFDPICRMTKSYSVDIILSTLHFNGINKVSHIQLQMYS